MKCRKILSGVLLGLCLSFVSAPVISQGGTSEVVYAFDEIGESGGESSSSGGFDFSGTDVSEYDNGVADFMKGHRAMTEEQLNKASTAVSPVTQFFGYIIGAIVALVSGGIFVITALDLAYIAIPFTRDWLFVDGQAQQGGNMYGQQPPSTHEKRQWVSDEAVQCAALIGNNQNPQPQGGGGFGGGFGGGYGGGGFQQQPPQSPQNTTKSVIATYFKKRVIFLILFTICTIVLTSSIFMGTGVNLANWFMKLIGTLNNYIPK